ncbi:HAD-like domain-containing protein [Umbelopsis sp. AD052]|nr:HAD-like domain-containing protein [Umbelopsis sp. AD052]
MASRLLRAFVPQVRQPRLTTRFTSQRLFATERSNVGENANQGLAAEALAQKVGSSAAKRATLPKGDKKPVKAAGEKDNNWKIYAGVGGVATGLVGLGFFHYGRPFEDGREDKYASENALLAAAHRARDRYEEFTKTMSEPMWDKLLPDPLPEPYRRPYTLVINLDDTLIHSSWDKEHGWRHGKRPGVDYFLAYLSQFYEIVIFTSQSFANALPILDKLDPYQYAMYRLYREATRYENGEYIKDLSHLNRDLSKVIIMDSNPQAFSKQPENGIAMKPWQGQANDNGLMEFIPFLEAIALTNVEDVRPVLASFSGTHIPAEWAAREEQMNAIARQKWEEEQKTTKVKRNLGNLFGSGGGAVAQTENQPPLTYLEQMRKHVRETFNSEHEQMQKQQDEMMKKEIEAQKQQMKEMKMTVWEMMGQISSGQPMAPQPGQPEQAQPQAQQ